MLRAVRVEFSDIDCLLPFPIHLVKSLLGWCHLRRLAVRMLLKGLVTTHRHYLDAWTLHDRE